MNSSLNLPLRLLALIILALGFATSATAITYGGTMTCAVTQTNDPLFAMGTVFQNSFYHESDSIDGTFHSTFVNGLHEQSDLFGQILAAAQGHTAPSYAYLPIAQIFLNTGANNHLTVLNGEVTDFLWDIETGFGGTTYSDSSFLLFNETDTAAFNVSGVVTFSSITASVPDTTSTMMLFGFGFLALAAYGSWHRAQIR